MWRRAAGVLVMLGTVFMPEVAVAASVEDNKQTVLEMTAAINARDLDALDALVTPDVRRHCGATPDIEVKSLDEFKAFLESDFAAVPDSVQTVNLMLGEGDLVAAHVTYAGTQSGPMGPFPPSGKHLEIPFIGILRLEEGKVAEIWVEWDNMNALMQLGHLSPPGVPAVE